jgi:hypothetical protein
MPYQIKSNGKNFQVVNKDTGKVKGTHASKEKAVKQMRLLYMVEGGKKPAEGSYSKAAVGMLAKKNGMEMKES